MIAQKNLQAADMLNDKKRAWNTVASEIRFSKGEGFELSYIRDHINVLLDGQMMRNNEVKMLLMNER